MRGSFHSFMKTLITTLIILSATVHFSAGSWLSQGTGNVTKTVHKAVQDIGSEADRAKRNVEGSGSKEAAVATAKKEIDESAQALQLSAQETIQTEERAKAVEAREKALIVRTQQLERNESLLKTGIFGCAATCVIGVVTVLSTGVLGRHDRHLKLLERAKMERELKALGLDPKTIDGYTVVAPPT